MLKLTLTKINKSAYKHKTVFIKKKQQFTFTKIAFHAVYDYGDIS